MDEQFDNNLKNHIGRAFENLDYPTADEGWSMLRKKFPAKDKDRPVIWMWRLAAAAAAAVILAVGVVTWFSYQNNDHKIVAKKPSKIERVDKYDQLANKNTTPTQVIDSVTTTLASPTPDKKTTTSEPFVNAHQLPDDIFKQQPVPYKRTLPNAGIDNNIKDNNLAETAVTNTPAINEIAAVVKDSTANKPAQIAAAKKQPADELLKPGIYNIEDNKPINTIKDNTKKVKFGVYAATYVNYAKGSENQVNMGLGFTSDIKISKKVKLSTGVAIAQNSLNYINQPSPEVRLYNAATVNTFNGAANAYNFNNAATTPTIKNYNALLVGLDIPLNLKYEFNPQKSRNYIVVGLSSGTFINESYTYNFNAPNYNGLATLAGPQQPQSQTTKSSFNDFYFARTLNLSFGVGYPLGKDHLIIEPFLKYPLAGLGAQQIRFGAGGVNLKFDFQSSKK